MPESNERKNEFLQSVNDLTADEIRAKKKKKRRMSDVLFDNLRYLLIAVCTVTLVISVVNIVDALGGYSEQDDIYDNIGNFVMNNDGVEMMFSTPDMPATPDHKSSLTLSDSDLSDFLNTAVVNKEYARVRVKLANLKSRYPDLYGWITVEGTNINYPIMQTTNNDYYLNHSYTGAYLGAGAIFADYTCEELLLDNRNLVVYGHHMSNSSMFHQLDNFLKESFYRNNGKVTVYTLEGMYTYEIFSIYETNMYYPYITTYFADDERFISFANEIEGNSIYKNNEDIVFTPDSKLLTLSTCNNRFAEGRLAVHAVMTERYTNPGA